MYVCDVNLWSVAVVADSVPLGLRKCAVRTQHYYTVST